MNREQRRRLLRRGYMEASRLDIAALERSGGILWEPGKEGREGWAICPCCGMRELHIVFDATKDDE